jgi:phenylacetate-CoA ligase
MNPLEEWMNAPWPELIRRARESGPQFVLRYLKMLRRQWLPKEQIRRYQEQRLERILRHALEQVPAYMEVPGIKTSAVRGRGFRALEHFRLLDRSTLMERREQFVARNAGRYSPKLRRTGGTTGKPVSLYLDGRTRALWNMMVLLRMQWAGSRPGDRTCVFGLSYGDLPGSVSVETPYVLDRSRRELFINGARLDDRRLREFARLVVSFRPHLLRGIPSLLVLLARAITTQHMSLRLRAVLTGGELLSDEQRGYLEETFACKVFDHYNMWEMVAFAPQCGRGSYHLIPELSYVEVLRNGQPCQPGEVGEIVGTHLDNYAMPLVRYNMNDLATPVGSPCECGRTLESIRLIGGKGRDLVVTPRGYVVLPAGQVTAKLDPPVRIEKLQFYQEHKEELLVRIVRGNGHTEDDTRRLLAQVDRMLEGAVRLRWEYVEDIPRTPSGKYPYVVCHVPLEL